MSDFTCDCGNPLDVPGPPSMCSECRDACEELVDPCADTVPAPAFHHTEEN